MVDINADYMNNFNNNYNLSYHDDKAFYGNYSSYDDKNDNYPYNNYNKNEQEYNSEDSHKSENKNCYSDKNDKNKKINKSNVSFCNFIAELIFCFMLIIISLADSFLQLYFKFFNAYSISDDIAIFIISILYLFFTFKRKNKLRQFLLRISYYNCFVCGFH